MQSTAKRVSRKIQTTIP